MSKMNKRTVWIVLSVLLCAGVFVALRGQWGPSVVHADDAFRTTSLGLVGSHPLAQGAPAILSTFNTTSCQDVKMDVTWHMTFPGGPTVEADGSTHTRTDTNIPGYLDLGCAQALYPSGTQITATFTAWDSSASVTFSYARSLTLP